MNNKFNTGLGFHFADEPPTEVLSEGMVFADYQGRFHILAQVDASKIALIGLHDGNRWTSPVEVNSPHSISRKEWNEITDGLDRLIYKGRFEINLTINEE